MATLEIKDFSLSVMANRISAPILRNVNVKVGEAEVVAIVGETGSGKTLTAKAVMGILPWNSFIDSGHIFFERTDLLALQPLEALKARKKISMIFQNPMSSLNQLFKIKDQMNDVLQWSSQDESSLTSQDRLQTVTSALDQVKLGESVLDMYPFQLSGGMRQRVMIAMALLRNPELLIADEPTTALDVQTQKQVLSLLRELANRKSMSLLLITHNLGIAFEMAERTYVFYAGRVVEEGATSSLFRNPLHPYTSGLIDSIPSLDKSRAMAGIPGQISQADRSAGSCCFSRRCPKAIAVCMSEEPHLEEFESGHHAACFVVNDASVRNRN
jgi:peptide/nickel transport system ATP-binding protein